MPLEVRKTVTVLFCDVIGSTTLGERQDPEQIRRVLSRYFEVARDILQRHGGSVEKFMGDAVMAVFGVPVLHEDDALRALRAAAELRDAIDGLNEELEQVYGIRIAVRIGVNSGEVIAGDTLRGHSFAAGDAVNVAQRLESTAEVGEILLGDMTYRLARDAIRTEPVGPLALKGREEPVAAHRLIEVLPGVLSHIRRLDSPMVGRSRELQTLADAFERAAAERSCHLFTVLGAAGVGKSRLVREVVREIGDRARLLVGTCLPYGDGITFWPALEVVKQGTGIVDGDSAQEALAKIAATVGDDDSARLAAERVAALVGLEETGETAEQGFWGFRKLIEALTRELPVILLFDDVNSGEPHFLDLIEYLAEWVRDVPLLIVCMARPELLDTRPQWGGGKRNATSIFLEPLSADESRELLGNLLSVDVDEDVLAQVQRSAEGNPLFVEEMVSMLIDGGYLSEDGDGPQLSLDRLPVPASIQVLLASRLDQLAGEERRVLERAAVEGAVFHSGAVEALSDDDLRPHVDECLGGLVRKELIRPYRASFAGVDAFRFRHVLIREAAYDSVPKQLRAEFHERFAAWLEEVAGERLPEFEEVLGYHLEQAYRSRLQVLREDDRGHAVALRASSRLASAGRRALARGDYPAAANLMGRARSLLASGDGAQADLFLDLAGALWQTGELAEADEALTSAVEAAEREGNTALGERAEVERAAIRAYLGQDAESLLRVSEQAIAAFARSGDALASAKAWRHLATAHWLQCRFGAMEEALERSLAYAERAGDEREIATVLEGLCRVALLGPRPAEEGVRRCRDTLARASRDLTLAAVAQALLGSLTAMEGHVEEGRELVTSAESAFEDLGAELKLAGVTMYVAFVELLAREWVRAEHALRRGHAALESMGERAQLATVAALLARALLEQGRLEEAARFTAVSEASASADDVFSQVLWKSTQARILARQERLPEAEQLARDALAMAEETDSPMMRADALRDLADVLMLVGNEVEAAERLDDAVQLYDAKGNVVSAGEAREALAGLDLGTPTC
jgi:class 3 adenylate cyclase/tetratricopeptide (TPR) repeat protein